MRRTCALAVEHRTAIGAHVSYPDVVGFGRRFVDMTPTALTDQVLAQARGKTGRAYFDAVDAASKQIVAECEKDGSVRCSVANMYYGTDFYRIAQLELSDLCRKPSVG